METCLNATFPNTLRASLAGVMLMTGPIMAADQPPMMRQVRIDSEVKSGPSESRFPRIYPIHQEPAGVEDEVAPTGIKKGTTSNASGHSFDFNSQYFLRDGKPWLPVMGEMHYSRIPLESWGDILDKAKDAGLDLIATYVFWIHHQEVEGEFDWSGNRDLARFLDLCQQKGLKVVLRIGPWCHGEVRNGGFPDWLLKKGYQLRSADPGYLETCRKHFTALSRQTAGRYFKDGGPVVGLQLENEYGWRESGQIEYMYALKRMVVDLGMDVPVYFQFSPTYPAEQTEFLTTKGGYCDAPWGAGTQRQVREYHYNFKGITFDSMVGSDLFGQRQDTVSAVAFPSSMAEFGGGFQVTYHRRPRLFHGDIASAAYVRIGSGANLMGYYMFHGGSNPLGKQSTLQESRATQYPNDVPILSYDFQAPIGEWGEAHEQLADLRLLHLALNDFGSRIAPMKAYLPPQRELRYAVRVRGSEGCVFFNNHIRYVPSPDVEGVQFELKRPDEAGVLWPQQPFTVPSGSYGVFPFGWPLAGARLNWATAQPVCVLDNQDAKTWVFAAVDGIEPEFDFASDTIERRSTDGNLTRIVTRDGETIELLLLTRTEALTAHKVRLGGREHLVLSSAMLRVDGDTMRFQLWEGHELQWKSYPALPGHGAPTVLKGSCFSSHLHGFPPATLVVRSDNRRVAEAMSKEEASLPQPGPLYGPEFRMIPGSSTWNLSVTGNPVESAADYLVEVDYDGDTISLYHGDKLVADDFQRGVPMRFLLKRVTGGRYRDAELRLQIMPFTPDRDVYLEDPALKTNGLTATVRSIRVIPVYAMTIEARPSTNPAPGAL